MSKTSNNETDRSNSETVKSSFTPIMTAFLGLIGTLATVYFGYKIAYNNVWLPITVTQTAEARTATQSSGQVALASTLEFPSNALGELPPTETPSPLQSTATIAPSLCCLAGWDIFSTTGSSYFAEPLGNCPNTGIDELGIHASNCSFVFAREKIKDRGIYGLSMPIQQNATIEMWVSITTLIEGEFWIGFSNGVDPQYGSLIYAMTPDPGGVSVYSNDISSANSRYRWADMAPDIGWVKGQPRLYKFTIKLYGNNVSVLVNSVKFADIAASSTNRLFVGYRSKPESAGTYVDATISKFVITPAQ